MSASFCKLRKFIHPHLKLSELFPFLILCELTQPVWRRKESWKLSSSKRKFANSSHRKCFQLQTFLPTNFLLAHKLSLIQTFRSDFPLTRKLSLANFSFHPGFSRWRCRLTSRSLQVEKCRNIKPLVKKMKKQNFIRLREKVCRGSSDLSKLFCVTKVVFRWSCCRRSL